MMLFSYHSYKHYAFPVSVDLGLFTVSRRLEPMLQAVQIDSVDQYSQRLALDFGRLTVSCLILIANQNWILLYGGVLLFFWKKASTLSHRVLGFTATLSFTILASACSWQMAIALAIFTLACGFTYLVTFAGPSDLESKAREQALRFGGQ